jgi:hypothetical protein
MNVRGYLRWQFAGSLSSPSFWGFSIIMLGILALFAGCPTPWPQIMVGAGFFAVIADAARSWFRFSYSLYELERRSIERELERKQ